MILYVRFTCFVCRKENLLLRHRRNTRYGWVANPYPTGTCAPQDAPSFAWRANAELKCGQGYWQNRYVSLMKHIEFIYKKGRPPLPVSLE
jgi:hypothetical protein